eukprot:m.254231 g.254231  ORF g.254231 m.254231 type:complete len:586 (-) comp26728_c1_seq2:34-1791(-)
MNHRLLRYVLVFIILSTTTTLIISFLVSRQAPEPPLYDAHSHVDLYVGENILAADLTATLGLRGWWMPHARWDLWASCDSPTEPCLPVFSTKCRAESVRAIYQYLPIFSTPSRQGQRLVGFNFSVYGNAIDLISKPSSLKSVEEQLFAVLLEVRLANSQNPKITQRITFSPGTYDKPLLAYSYIPIGAEVDIQGILIALVCSGYVGKFWFQNPELRPVFQQTREQQVLPLASKPLVPTHFPSIVNYCPIFSDDKMEEGDRDLPSILIQASEFDTNKYLVTMVTQISIDRLNTLKITSASWKAPISLVIYVPSQTTNVEKDFSWKEFYIRKKLHEATDAQTSKLWNVIAVFGRKKNDPYPINTLRNLALWNARTEYVFLNDADFVPAMDFQTAFSSSLQAARDLGLSDDKTAFVVPAFEFTSHSKNDIVVPHDKEQLLEQVKRKKIRPFRIKQSPASHSPTNYQRWYLTPSGVYPIEDYEDKFEPYCVVKLSDTLPSYDPRFENYGMNKIEHIMELYAAGYQFAVMANAWTTHVPHPETKISKAFLTSPKARFQNRWERFSFLAWLQHKYMLNECANGEGQLEAKQ